jgi:hypothetical protein
MFRQLLRTMKWREQEICTPNLTSKEGSGPRVRNMPSTHISVPKKVSPVLPSQSEMEWSSLRGKIKI